MKTTENIANFDFKKGIKQLTGSPNFDLSIKSNAEELITLLRNYCQISPSTKLSYQIEFQKNSSTLYNYALTFEYDISRINEVKIELINFRSLFHLD